MTKKHTTTRLRGRLLTIGALLGLAIAGNTRAGTYTQDFNTDPAADPTIQLTGTSSWVATGGFNNSGYVSLTTADPAGNQAGGLILPDFDAGASAGSILLNMKLWIGPGAGRPADGFSINYASDIADGSTPSEEGAGTGITISFDTWDNNDTDTAPAIELKVGGNTVATAFMTGQREGGRAYGGPLTLDNAGQPMSIEAPTFQDCTLEIKDGLLNLTYKGVKIFKSVAVGIPGAGRFAFGARTGGAVDNHAVDEISITTAPPSGPIVQSVRSSPSSLVITLQDQATQVNPSTVKLTVNGTTITPTVTRSGDLTSIVYTPAAPFAPNTAGVAELIFGDTSAPSVSRTNTLNFATGPYTLIPEGAAGVGTVDTTTRGFHVEISQIPVGRGPGDPNWIINGERQLANGYIDPATGQPYANSAAPGPNADGSYTDPDVINWSQDGTDAGNFTSANGHPEETFPGLPSADQDNVAAEITAFLDLKPGSYRMGVNSDDGFRVSVSPGKEDVFGTVIGSFNGGRGASDTMFDFVVTKAGKYPFRLTWWEGGGGANVEWFVEDVTTGVRTLINDPAAANAIVAYANGTGAAYVESVLPVENDVEVPETSNIEIVVVNDATTASNFQLKVNGVAVTPTITTTGNSTKIVYDPPANFSGGKRIDVSLTYTDSALGARTVNYSFTVTQAIAGAFFVEAEDFNHSSGQHEAAADVMPYLGDAYNALTATEGIDYNDPGAAENDSYARASGPANAAITYDKSRGTFSVNTDYKVGWNDAGDWYNYTRVFPTTGVTNYLIFGRISSGGLPESVRFDRVTSDPSVTPQTVQKLGDFNAPATGGWDTMGTVPLQSAFGDPVTVAIAGTNTFRATINPNSNEDINYFMFVPTTDSAPALVGLNPLPGGKAPGSTTIDFTYQDGVAKVNTSTIKMTINGSAVTPTFTTSGSQTKISYKPTPDLVPSQSYTAEVTFTDTAGNNKTNTVTFTTVKPIAGTPPYVQGDDGMVVMEAENNDRMLEQGGHAWTAIDPALKPGFSGTTALQATPNSGANNGTYPDYMAQSPRLDYKVRFKQAGDVYVWIRGSTPDNANGGGDDSIHAGLDYDEAPPGGGTARRMDNTFNSTAAPYGNWNWVGKISSGTAAKITVPTAGDHVFNLWMREDGLIVDKIILTTNANFVPTDPSPAETARAPMYQEKNGQVVVEAEHFSNRANGLDGVHKYTVVPDEVPDLTTLPADIQNARGEKFVMVLPEAGENRSGLGVAGVVGPPYIEWSVQISTPGDYQLYMRDTGYDGGADSVYVQIMEMKRDNGGQGPDWYRYSPDPTGPDFNAIENINGDTTTVIGWNGYAAKEATSGDGGEEPAIWTNVKPGIYTVRMAQREDGNAVDAFIFQLASLPPPTSPGPAESPLVGVVVEPPPVKITASTLAGGNITITWTGGGTLEWTTALAPGGTWTSTNDTDGSYTEPVTTAQKKFFRVRK